MKNAEMNVVRFNNEDVIATSGAVTLGFSGFGDGDTTNNQIIINGVAVNFLDANGALNVAGFEAAGASGIDLGTQVGNSKKMSTFRAAIKNGDTQFADYNGSSFVWDASASKFTRQ